MKVRPPDMLLQEISANPITSVPVNFHGYLQRIISEIILQFIRGLVSDLSHHLTVCCFFFLSSDGISTWV